MIAWALQGAVFPTSTQGPLTAIKLLNDIVGKSRRNAWIC